MKSWVNGRWALLASRTLRVLATVWIAWVLAGVFWLLSGHSAARLPAPLPQTALTHAPAVDVSRLAMADLFGQPAITAAKGSAADAPDTSLQLRLTGVFANSDPQFSSAIIAERNNPAVPAKIYRINDGLPGGATLAEVYDDRILIRRGGSSEVLRFEKTNLLNAAGAAPVAANAEGDWRSMLSDAIRSMSANPEQFVQQMGLKPGANGYEVTAATPENLRNSAGLQPGDWLVSVNGNRLGDPRRDRGVLSGVQSSGQVSVEMKRGGQTVSLDYKL